jgi:adenylate cyclase
MEPAGKGGRHPRLDLPSRGRRALTGLVLGALVAGLCLAGRRTSLGQDLEHTCLDLRTRHFAGERAPDPRIVLMQVGEPDVDWVRCQLGIPWPWEQELDATIVAMLAEAGVMALVVDVLYFDGGAGPDDMVGCPEPGEAVLQRREFEAMQAETLGSALSALGRVALAVELSASPLYEVPARVAAAEGRWGEIEGPLPERALTRPGANLPVRRVLEGATRLGFANVRPDPDGVTRRATVVAQSGVRTVGSLALAAAALAADATPRLEEDAIVLGDVRQPLDEDGSFVVDFRKAGRGAYPAVSPAQVVAWTLDVRNQEKDPEKARIAREEARAALEGKIVVFGVNLAGQEDVLATSVHGVYDGPEFQATAIDDLLHGNGRVLAPQRTNDVLLVLLLLVAGVGALAPKRRLWLHAAPALLAALHGFAAFHVFGSNRLVLDLGTPVVGLGLLWAAGLAYRLLTEGRRNRWLEGTFGMYLAPSIIEELKKDPTRLALGGHERDITILFSDIAGFTGQSERLTPTQLVDLLNEYLTRHTEAVHAEGGVVDKFIGDAVMGFWGDPLPTPDHALRACRTALAVRDGLPALEPLWRKLGLTHFEVRFGVNSGPAVVGNMGSRTRFSYTAMGDSVNLASRLEGANKFFGSQILLGPGTHTAVANEMLCRPLAEIAVKGKEQAVAVCELLAAKAGAPADLVAHLRAYEEAHRALREGRLDAARAALSEAERLRPGDGPTAWLRDLLGRMEQGSEPVPWSGRVRLDAK